MCRYAFHDYKQHLACFSCRKAFKAFDRVVIANAGCEPALKVRTVSCPECRRPMVAMGLDFKAPRQSNWKQWRKVEILTRHGIRFNSCGCGGPGYRPRTLAEVRPFLASRPRPSPGETLLDAWRLRRPPGEALLDMFARRKTRSR